MHFLPDAVPHLGVLSRDLLEVLNRRADERLTHEQRMVLLHQTKDEEQQQERADITSGPSE